MAALPLPARPRRSALLTCTLLCAVLMTACGDGVVVEDDPPAAPPPPPPPAVNQAPVAAFTAPATAVAGQAVLLDARATRDPENDPLTFSWDFGNGLRGGGERIGHVFDQAGSYTVRLTVDDGQGGVAQVQQAIAVSAGAAPAGHVDSAVSVRSLQGEPLADVAITLLDGSAQAQTAANGRATLRTPTGVARVLRFSKPGYAEQIRRVEVPASDEPGFLQVTLHPRQAAVTLADAAAGGSVDGLDGVRVVFAPGSLVDAAGAPVSGAVQVAMTPVDVTEQPRSFPGRFEGLAPDGEEGLIMSFGVVEVVLQQGGQPVQLAPGRSATLDIPVYAGMGRDGRPLQAGDTYSLWSLNPRTGLWVVEGTGTVVEAPGTPEGLALRGEVTHFSWWNHDVFAGPPYRPRPKCLVDSNYDGVLEDLSGTGYCWHEAGTPTNWEPRLRQNRVDPVAGRSRALQARPMNDPPPGLTREPAFIATAATPAAGGQALPIPADTDIIFHSYARNGTLFGRTVVRGGAGVSEDVNMVLSPIEDAEGTVAITLPWNRVYAMGHVGETDRFQFTAAAGQNIELQLSRSNGSVLSGTASLRGPDGSTVASGDIGSAAATLVVSDAPAGTYTVEVRASGSAPGAYRLQARSLAGNCGASAALTMPVDQTVRLVRSGLSCFEVELAAAQVLDLEVPAPGGGLAGQLQLRSPAGEVLAQQVFRTGQMAVLRAGVPQAGRYRLELVNTSTVTGDVRLRGSAYTLADMGWPDTLTVSGVASGDNHSVLLRQATPGEAFALALHACNGNFDITVFPSRRSFQGGSGFCGQSTTTRALSFSEHPGVLPVVQVRRRVDNTSSLQAAFTLISQAVLPLALDADTAVTAPPRGQGAVVYTFDGQAGQELSWGRELPLHAANWPSLQVLAPDGAAVVAPWGEVWALPADGRYTLVVSNDGSFTGDFTMRVNSAPAPVALSLVDGRLERNDSLVLGQVRRYRFDLAQGEVFAIGLQSGGLDGARASVGTAASGHASVTLPAAGSAVQSAPVYASGAGPRELVVGSASPDAGATRGEFTLSVLRPLAQSAQTGQLLNGTLAPLAMRAFDFDISAAAASGYHLLRSAFPLANTEPLRGVVWGPSAPHVNYDGDLRSPQPNGTSEVTARLRAGVNRLTLDRPAPPWGNLPGSHQAAYSVVLVPLAAPQAITLGAAAQQHTLQLPGERRYHRFEALVNQGYTVTVQAGFAGTLSVYKLAPNGDYTRAGSGLLPDFPRTLVAGQSASLSFTVPASLVSGAVLGSGTYVIELDAEGETTGSYTLGINNP